MKLAHRSVLKQMVIPTTGAAENTAAAVVLKTQYLTFGSTYYAAL